MALTAAMINQAKPTDKRFSLKDENGLYLEVSPTGKKLWRVRYWYHGKENRIGLGPYPKVTLAEARKKCAELKDLIADDIDPVTSKRAAKREHQIAESSSFQKIAQAWVAKERLNWSDGHTETVIQRLNCIPPAAAINSVIAELRIFFVIAINYIIATTAPDFVITFAAVKFVIIAISLPGLICTGISIITVTIN